MACHTDYLLASYHYTINTNTNINPILYLTHVGSGFVRIDLLRFLAGCRRPTRQLNQA